MTGPSTIVSEDASAGEVQQSLSLKRRLLSGGAWAFGGRVVTAFTALASNALLARLLSPQELGAYFLAFSLVSLGGVAGSLGLNQVAVRFVAESVGHEQFERARDVIGKVFKLGIVGAMCVALACLLLVPAVGVSLFNAPALVAVTGLVAGWMVISALQTLLAETFRGFHDIRLATIFGGLVGGGGLLTGVLLSACLLMLWLGRVEPTLSTVIYLAMGSGGASALLAGWALRRKLAALPASTSGDEARTTELLQVAWPLLATSVALIALTQADIWVVGAFLPQEEVAVYRAASRLALMTLMVSSILQAVLPPVIAEKHSRNEKGSLQKVLRAGATANTILVLPLLFPFILIPGEILSLIFGQYYRSGGWVLVLISLGLFVNVITGIRGHALMMTGHERTQLAITLTMGSLAVLLCSFGAVVWGTVGVALAAMVAMVSQCFTELLFVRRRLGIWTHASLVSLRDIKALAAVATSRNS